MSIFNESNYVTKILTIDLYNNKVRIVTIKTQNIGDDEDVMLSIYADKEQVQILIKELQDLEQKLL
jgi:hypothetical protein